jgi:hypothetical protein
MIIDSTYRHGANRSETFLVSYQTHHPEIMFSPAEKLSTLRQVGVTRHAFRETSGHYCVSHRTLAGLKGPVRHGH